MKYATLFIFLLSSSIFCQDVYCQTKAVITGSYEGSQDGDIVFLKPRSVGEREYTTTIDKGTFSFEIDAGNEWVVYFVSCPGVSDKLAYPLFFKNGSMLDFKIDKSLKTPVFSGDWNALEQNDFFEGMIILSRGMDSISALASQTNDKDEQKKFKTALNKYQDDMDRYPVEWVENHPSSPFSLAVINLFITSNMLYEADTMAEKYFDLLTPVAIKDNNEAYILIREMSQFNSKYKNFEVVKGEGTVSQSVKYLAPTFSIRDTSGHEILLSDFKDKYLLIDFWASWCAPCRENNPELKRLYHQYKDKGLQLLSISMDTDAEKWKRAIIADNMDWLQGTDLKGIEGGVGRKYLINGIPNYLLINPDNTVEFLAHESLETIEKKLALIFENPDE